MSQDSGSQQQRSSKWSLQNARWDDPVQAEEDGLYVTDEEHRAMMQDKKQNPSQPPAYSTQPSLPALNPSLPALASRIYPSQGYSQHSFKLQLTPNLEQHRQVYQPSGTEQPLHSTPHFLSTPQDVIPPFQGSTASTRAPSDFRHLLATHLSSLSDDEVELVQPLSLPSASHARKSVPVPAAVTPTPASSKKRATGSEPPILSKRSRTKKSGGDEDNDSKGKAGGRKTGSMNYSVEELRYLVHLVGEVLPTGPDGWEDITRRYSTWSRAQQLPDRLKDGLRKKFYTLAHATKPTGDPVIADYIEKAKSVDFKIQGKTHMVDLGDDNDDPIVPIESFPTLPLDRSNAESRNEETPEAHVIYKREATTPTPATTWASRKPSGQRSSSGAEALKQMTSYFDPSVRTQLNNNQAVNNMFLGQIDSLQAQLRYKDEEIDKLRKEMRDVEREKERQMDDLRRELRNVEKELTASQRSADRLEAELNMLRMFQHRGTSNSFPGPRSDAHSYTIFPEPGRNYQHPPSPSIRESGGSSTPRKSSSIAAGNSVELTFLNGGITLTPSKCANPH